MNQRESELLLGMVIQIVFWFVCMGIGGALGGEDSMAWGCIGGLICTACGIPARWIV